MSLYRTLTGRRTRRDVDDERQAAEATTYFRDLTAPVAEMSDEELGGEPEVDADAPTTEIETIPPAPAPDIRQRPTTPADAPGWTEEDVRRDSARLRAAVEAARAQHDEEHGAAMLPEPRRRHLPAVGTWLASALRPVHAPAIPRVDAPPASCVLLPAIPDARRYRVLPVASPSAVPAATSLPDYGSGAGDEHPDDFVEWLRAELADTFAMCDAAIAEHAATAAADLAALEATFVQNVGQQLDELNAATLPGWTDLENTIHHMGVFAS